MVATARILGAGTVASLVAGIPAGLAARAAMAVLGAAGGASMMAVVGEVTLSGTLRILVVPMVFGIPFAWLLLAAGGRWVRRPTAVRVVAYALAALVLPGLPFLTDAEFKVAGPNGAIGPWLFVPVFLVYGALVGLVGDWLLGRRSPQGAEEASATIRGE